MLVFITIVRTDAVSSIYETRGILCDKMKNFSIEIIYEREREQKEEKKKRREYSGKNRGKKKNDK